jgi:putative membrane protein insertion efficiency factor
MKKIVLMLITLYQKTLSYDHGFMGKIFPNMRFCRHTPTCSEYGYQAVDKYGVIKGGWIAFLRVLRCGPWTPAGTYDPVK